MSISMVGSSTGRQPTRPEGDHGTMPGTSLPSDAIDHLIDELVRNGRALVPDTAYLLEFRADAEELLLGTATSTGCLECARHWRQDTSDLVPAEGDRGWLRDGPWRAAVSAAIGGHLDGQTRHAPGSVRVINRLEATVEDHSYLQHPRCGRCTPRHSRSSATALDLTAPAPATAGTLRVAPLQTEAWLDRINDRRHGPLAQTYRDEHSPLALVTSEFVIPGHPQRESGYGRSASFDASSGPALLEGIERVAGARRAAEVPTLTASARQLGPDAVDLPSLGGHDPECVRRTPTLVPWTPDLQTTWVGARSVLADRPLWVPEQLAYYHLPAGQPRFVYESSNGCAVGGSLEEAALHGYYEVVERDAFLLAWYSQTRLRRITGADTDPQIGHLLDALAAEGLHVDLLDMTSDHGVPTALAVITAPDAVAAQDLFPSLSLASAAHADGRQALRTALEECATNVLMYQRWKELRPSVSITRCRPMLDNHDLVRYLEDHTGLHGLPEARPLNEFLRHPAGSIGVEEFCAAGPVLDDVVAQLRLHLETIARLGSDLIVVDQTDPTYATAVPVHAVKVLVPGTVPMTFGHLHRRVLGLPRLHRASTLLNGGVSWTRPGRLVLAPHPFP